MPSATERPARLIVVHDAGDRGRPVGHLLEVAVRALGLGATSGAVRHHCPRCGATDHGRPSLAGSGPSPAGHVSIARCPGRLVVALTDAGPIGVDVERSGAADSDEVDLVFGVGSGDPTRRWVRGEALLKATGRGLAGVGAQPLPVPVWTSSLDLGPDYEAALAVLTGLTSAGPDVRVIRAGPAGLPG